jgi:hypothetical protein
VISGLGSAEIVAWLNANQGVLSLALFAATVFAGWISGIFSALRRRPKFRISLIEGPTFACTFGAPASAGFDLVHRTGIALYLDIANVGSASSSIVAFKVGYHWALVPFSKDWLRYRVGWFWLKNQSVSLEDFQAAIGEHIKFYPFLTQKSTISGHSAEGYLQIGQSTNGVVYFEQSDSWGACFPLSINRRVSVRIGVQDVFGKWHYWKGTIPKVSLEEARRYNPSFGLTLSSMRDGDEPFELATDGHGNILPIQQPPLRPTGDSEQPNAR